MTLLSILPSFLGFSLSRGGSCTGYRWDVEWTDKPGDQTDMVVSGEDLEGADVQITVEALTNGGLWIRPLRGDMLRLPETEPQVCAWCTCEHTQLLLLLLTYSLFAG